MTEQELTNEVLAIAKENGVLAPLTAAERNKRFRERHPDRTKSYLLKHRYGITLKQYNELLSLQGGGCSICGKTPEENGAFLSVDHDHKHCPGKRGCKDCIRGLLCIDCNRGLGCFHDNQEFLENATEYIRIWND